MSARRATLTVGVLLLVGCATTNRPSLPFLERMYVARVPSDTSLLFEAQVATHILAVDGLGNAYQRVSTDPAASHVHAWRVILNPMFRIRQLADSSAAVRTPSFMPRLSAEWLRVTRLGVTTTRPVVSYSRANLSGVRLSLQHHSNGQAGCFREGFRPLDARANECVPIAGADTTTVRINRANGDFSSTFVNFMVHSTWMNRAGDDRPTWTLGAAAGLDLHPPGIFGALSDEQRELYGGWRVRAQGEASWRSGVTCRDPGPRPTSRRVACALAGRTRITLEGERAPRYPGDLARRIRPAVLPYRTSVELSHTIDTALGLGPFVRWHDGQDYYNIGFVNRRRVVMWGLMIDLGGYDYLSGDAR